MADIGRNEAHGIENIAARKIEEIEKKIRQHMFEIHERIVMKEDT